MSTNPMMDAGIPVLTEIIPSPQAAEPPEEKPAPLAAAPTAQEELAQDDPDMLDISAALAQDEQQWDRLEREVRERVLHQVLERIDFMLEQRVRDSLADVLQTAVENLASDIRNGLHHSIRDVVTRAVAQEITKLQNASE